MAVIQHDDSKQEYIKGIKFGNNWRSALHFVSTYLTALAWLRVWGEDGSFPRFHLLSHKSSNNEDTIPTFA